MTVYRGSRYENTVLCGLIINNQVVPTFTKRLRAILDFSEAYHYVWAEGDRVDLIAERFYGDPQKWWLIMDANPHYETPFDILNGDVVTIPLYEVE